ncbi:GTP cyclohydrolase II [Algicella marina]|uniref:GTP cyclohydrolase-2 n=2 Tax=Algicella marina TaxID=2683284 RepID=A0A6P1T6Y4_9RHOB|nr:GTP cyclohydrolase II [Algicella marina]QHQ37440.1 GTP cyclohydrolase II [Algicella marina]
MGAAVVLRADDAFAVIQAAEVLRPERLADLRQVGVPEMALTRHRAETLRARAYDGDIARIAVPETADCHWIRAVAEPATDLDTPMKGPFLSLRDGNAGLHRAAISLCKSAHLIPAAVVVPLTEGAALAAANDLTLLDAGLVAPLAPVLHSVAAARVPLAVSSAGRVHVFRPEDGGEEHYVVEIGTPDRAAPVLTRLHSACFTGDVLGSLKCDCGAQLAAALAQMGAEGAGILLYLNQEGRGIGLANKMRAYSLQDQGFDTVEANHRLGFEDDERDFRIGAEILKKLGMVSVRLMTNNPAKVERMQANGIAVVERVPLKVGLRAENAAYLATKAAKSGHLL